MRRDRERLGGVNLRPSRKARGPEKARLVVTTDRDDLVEAIKAAPGHPEPQQGSPGSAPDRLRVVNTTSRGCSRRCSVAARPRCSSLRATIRWKPASRSSPSPRARNHRRCRCSRAASRRDRDGADLRGVPHQSVADLRARRSRRAARRPQCRTVLHLLQLDDRPTETRFVIITHNPITMARMNRVRRHHVRARRHPTRLGRACQEAVDILDQNVA